MASGLRLGSGTLHADSNNVHFAAFAFYSRRQLLHFKTFSFCAGKKCATFAPCWPTDLNSSPLAISPASPRAAPWMATKARSVTSPIIAGSFGFHGAGVLAARSAQRAQPGRITLFTQEKIYTAVAAARTIPGYTVGPGGAGNGPGNAAASPTPRHWPTCGAYRRNPVCDQDSI